MVELARVRIENNNCDETQFDERAKSMAKVYYERVFKKSVDAK